jgi:hypothetical protein
MKTLALTAPIVVLLLSPGGAATAAEERADAPVRIEFALRQALTADVTIPAVPELGGRTFSTVTRPGPGGGYWGGAWHFSVGLPRRLGRVEYSVGGSPLADQCSRRYSESPTVLASDLGDTGSSIYDLSERSFESSFGSLGWSNRLWSRHGWAIVGEASLRTAEARRRLADELAGPTVGEHGERHSASVTKNYLGLHAKLVASAPLAGSASLEAAVGGFLAHVSQECGGCNPTFPGVSSEPVYVLGTFDDSRTELMPDVSLRLRIPLSARLELSGGYRWESWGEDVFGKLGLSGRFFSLTALVGRLKR